VRRGPLAALSRSVARGLVVLASLLVATVPCAAESKPTPPAGPDTPALRAEADRLRGRLDALRRQPGVNPDRWADAHVFLKGALWALDLEPSLDAGKRASVQRALRRGNERADALAAGRAPWATRPGRSVRGFVSAVDGSTQPYGLSVPAGWHPAKPSRLDVVLHGSTGSRATGMGDLHFMEGFDPGDAAGQPAANADYIEVFPMGRLGENAYRFEGETDVDEAIEAVAREFAIDRRRVVLRGSSLGGVGAWALGLKRPDRYAAVGPAAGPVDTLEFSNSRWPHFVRLDPFTPWQTPMLHLVDAIDYVPNARMVPIVAAMGDQDPYFTSHRMVERAFGDEGIPFVGLVDRGAGHGIGAKVMGEQLRLLGEHAARGADPAPKEIHFVTWTLKFSRCHWIEVLGLGAHYRRAQVDAVLADDGSVTMVEPENVVRLAFRPPALQGPAATLTIGGQRVALRVAAGPDGTVEVVRRDRRWVAASAPAGGRPTGKRPGLQGPIDDAFATRFLCVRGTGKPWNPAVGVWAEANLRRFADEWRRHYRGDLPFKNDTEVTEKDLRESNLVLFGDPGSNRWIRKVLPALPIRWNRHELRLGHRRYPAADHGVELIHPNPMPGAAGHYVVLNSGHTYHDAELRLSYKVFPRLGDWAVLRLGDNTPATPPRPVAETVLDSGFFGEDWGLR